MRAPFQVLIFPYRMEHSEPRFLIGRRADSGDWQAISGGGEDEETWLEAAQRELYEETSLTGSDWLQLDAMCMLPNVFYQDHQSWAGHPYVVPEYAFAVQVTEAALLSVEHSEFRWCRASQASKLLKYDSNLIALWEICRRFDLDDQHHIWPE